MEAEILKVAGLPGWTGSGTICTPLTFTGYFLPLPARHSKGEVTSRAFHTPRDPARTCGSREPKRSGAFRSGGGILTAVVDVGGDRGGGEEEEAGGDGGEDEEALLARHGGLVDSLCRGCVRWEDLFVRERDLRGGIYKKEEELGRWGKR